MQRTESSVRRSLPILSEKPMYTRKYISGYNRTPMDKDLFNGVAVLCSCFLAAVPTRSWSRRLRSSCHVLHFSSIELIPQGMGGTRSQISIDAVLRLKKNSVKFYEWHHGIWLGLQVSRFRVQFLDYFNAIDAYDGASRTFMFSNLCILIKRFLRERTKMNSIVSGKCLSVSVRLVGNENSVL